MTVTECDVPSASVLDRNLVAAAHFRDAYRAPLSRDAAIADVFHGIFGHTPCWMKRMLIVRNRLAALCGLAVPADADILDYRVKDSYVVGDRIGPWPIFALNERELVAGRDNRHMDFRLSLIKVKDDGGTSVVVSTICNVHNLFGKIYLFFIVPFHRHGVQKLMRNALSARRL
jgi:hypothetical protein